MLMQSVFISVPRACSWDSGIRPDWCTCPRKASSLHRRDTFEAVESFSFPVPGRELFSQALVSLPSCIYCSPRHLDGQRCIRFAVSGSYTQAYVFL